MKAKLLFPVLLLAPLFVSCNKVDTIGGAQSPIGEIGVTLSSSSASVAGVSNINAEVTGLEDGVSVYTGTAVVANDNIMNILTNFPEVEAEGNTITVTDIKIKSTVKGIESVSGLATGTIVDYDAKVGDEYKTSDGIRTVVSRSTDDDYYYGYFMIKVIEVEENVNNFGIKKIRYWANHRFGLVGMEFTFDDNSTAYYPVYASAEN
ncbi:MAG: hypothetical protein V2B15_10990 [Bacteroidota bacterium]